jgi:hypothetical protein
MGDIPPLNATRAACAIQVFSQQNPRKPTLISRRQPVLASKKA